MSQGSARCGTTGFTAVVEGAGAAAAAGAVTRVAPPAPASITAAAVPEPRKERREKWRLAESFMLKTSFRRAGGGESGEAGCQLVFLAKSRCSRMNTRSRPPMTILVHQELSVPS